MHILILPSYYPSEANPIAGTFIREQAWMLKRAGLQVGVVAPIVVSARNLKTQRKINFHKNLVADEKGVPTYRRFIWNYLPRIPYGLPKIWQTTASPIFKQYVADFGFPDLIHVQVAEYAGIFARSLKTRYGIPFVITEHSSSYALRALPKWHLHQIQKAYAAAHARVVVSPRLGEDLVTSLGAVTRPWVWIPNVVPSDFLELNMQIKKSDQFRILNIAWMEENKGQSFLIQAFAKYFRDDYGVELRIAGDGPLRQSVERMASELGIGRQVSFLGRLNRAETISEMQSADIFVLSSIYETFGVVLIEAMACGKPVVSTKSGGPESIVDETCGLLVAPRDPDALGMALSQMRGQIAKYDPEAIRSHCLARFGEKAVATQLLSVYQQV